MTDFGGLIHAIDSTGPVKIGDEKRMVENPKTGLSVFVTITAAERLRLVKLVPKGWSRAVELREGGMSIEEIGSKPEFRRFTTEELRTYLGLAYGWLEQAIWKLADIKAGAGRR